MKLQKGIAMAVVLPAMFSLTSANAGEWQVMIEPYIMASTIEGDASWGTIADTEVDLDFSDLRENLHAAGMLRYEAFHSSGWGVMADYGFMTQKKNFTGPKDGKIKAKVTQGVFQFEGAYRVNYGSANLDYSVGFRKWNNRLAVTLAPQGIEKELTRKTKESWFDLFVGARWTAEINDNWSYMLRGDIGGLGLEADFTAGLTAGVQYHINNTMTIDAQYKTTWVDYSTGKAGEQGSFAYDTVTHGPILGFIYRF